MDLGTDYLGLRLRNPLIAAASPLSQTIEGIRRLADAGIGAVVLYSQFEEQLADEPVPDGRRSAGENRDGPQRAEHLSPGQYLGLLEQARSAVDVPVIGGTTVLNVVAVSPSGATAHEQRTVVLDTVPGTLLLDVADADGDDHGPGNYAYPTSTSFKDGSFDIEQFQVFDAGTDVIFRLRTRDLTPTFGSPHGAQLVDVYVHVPGAAATSTEAANATRNFAVAAPFAWSRLIQVQGFGQRYVDATGAIGSWPGMITMGWIVPFTVSGTSPAQAKPFGCPFGWSAAESGPSNTTSRSAMSISSPAPSSGTGDGIGGSCPNRSVNRNADSVNSVLAWNAEMRSPCAPPANWLGRPTSAIAVSQSMRSQRSPRFFIGCRMRSGSWVTLWNASPLAQP